MQIAILILLSVILFIFIIFIIISMKKIFSSVKELGNKTNSYVNVVERDLYKKDYENRLKALNIVFEIETLSDKIKNDAVEVSPTSTLKKDIEDIFIKFSNLPPEINHYILNREVLLTQVQKLLSSSVQKK